MSRRETQRALQDQLAGAYYQSIDLILVNLSWFVFSVLVIPAIPALGGLYYATNGLAHGGGGSWRTFWEGFRRYFWLSWRWGLINAVVIGFLSLNAWFYGAHGGAWLGWLRPVFVGAIIVWGCLQVFTFPLLLEQADQRFITATRNSAVLFIRRPRLVLGALAQLALVALPSVFLFPPAWVVISGSLCAYLANRAVLRAIQSLREH